MFYSLRFRLLLTMIIVLTVAVGVVAVLASSLTTREFYHYVAYDDASRVERFVDVLSTYYTQTRGWDNVQPLIEQMSEISGARVALVDKDGMVIAASNDDLLGEDLEIGENGSVEVRVWVMDEAEQQFLVESGTLPTQNLRRDNRAAVGAVYVDNNSDDKESFIDSVNKSLVAAVFAAGFVALVLTVTVSRQVIKPLKNLTIAARAMEQGNLNQRVIVKSKDEIGELAHAFNAMAGSLIRLEQLRRNLISDVAHELRTPLSNIRGYLEALQDGLAEPDGDMINLLYEETMMLTHLVNDLQELALAEAGQLRLDRQPVTIKDVLEKTVVSVKPQASAKNVQVSVEIPYDLPCIQADPERIMQVVRNLLNNAITYTPEDGKIVVKAYQRGGEIQVNVQDTGIGVGTEHINNIFERFYRVDPSRTRHTGGVGLGLVIVKQLVEAHGGRVWAESQIGNGSTFSFTIPIRQFS